MFRNLRSNQFLVIGITVWLSFNLVRRWLYTPIFFSAGPYGIPQPPVLDQILVVVCAVLSAFLFSLIGLCLGMLHKRLGRFFIGIFALAALCVLEGDVGWYMLSKTHITTGDVILFATQNWHDHFGIQTHDITRFCMVAVAHVIAVLTIFYLDNWLRNYSGPNLLVTRVWQVFSYRHLVGGVLFFFLIGQCCTMFGVESGHPLWRVVAAANPFYVSAGDQWLHSRALPQEFLRLNEKIDAERRLFAGIERSSVDKVSVRNRPDILFVTVESWNANLANAENMPYFSSLEKSCHVRSNHYSGANQTELGVLSLLYGEPDVFFRGYREYATGVKQSVYIAGLSRLGYRLGRVVSDASQANTIPRYLTGFNEAEVVDKDDWNNIQTITTRLSRPGPDFIHAHYFRTHYPYIHAEKYSAHQPETAPDFSYQSFDMFEQRGSIINRYKNALSELDEWLESLLSKIDLNRTIVVITGDHGEEMFETGRLGHAATLEAPQVRTPLVICGPGIPAAGRSRVLSSHADVFPTVFAMLGIHDRLSVFGKSLFNADEPGLALIAKQNHGKLPVEWAVHLEQGQLYLKLRSDGKLEITGGDPQIQASLAKANKSAGATGFDDGTIVHAIVAAEKELSAAKAAEKKLASSAEVYVTKQ
jgi:phosphoglycerol transferase MdoB-like AlkP superfamily enzyme